MREEEGGRREEEGGGRREEGGGRREEGGGRNIESTDRSEVQFANLCFLKQMGQNKAYIVRFGSRCINN